jgi:cytochrome oxidase Cu insertion factor (SCO1/SenC/PrrC family)
MNQQPEPAQERDRASHRPSSAWGPHASRRWLSHVPWSAHGSAKTVRILTPIAVPARRAARQWLPAVAIGVLVVGCGPRDAVVGRPAPPPVVAGRVEVDEDAPASIAGTPFTLTDQLGETFSSADLAGKVWLGSIFFANCPGPCFRENLAIAEIVKEIAAPDFIAVSLTCDPTNDTPDVLRRYAERFEADAARWKFLTGDMQTISDVGLKTFRLPVEVGVHSERGVVFDRQGRLRGGYHLLQADKVEQLKKLIREVLAEPVAGSPESTP